MKLGEVFTRIGGELVRSDQADGALTLLARVRRDADSADRWKAGVDRMLEIAEGAEVWSLDLSRVYVRKNGQTVYYWRWIFSGDVPAALKLFAGLTRTVARASNEQLDTFPTVGRSPNKPNEPVNGTAGVYTAKGASNLFGANGVSSAGIGMAPR